MTKETIAQVNNALSFITQVHNHGYLNNSYEDTIKFLHECQLELPEEIIQHIEILISEAHWKRE